MQRSLISPLVPNTAEHEELESLSKSMEAGFNALVLLDGGPRDDALRQQLLDPDVMTAVIELNEATSATLDRLAEAEAEQGKALEEQLAEVDLRIKAIFKQVRVDESEKTQKFEAWLKGSAEARASGKKRPTARDFMAIGANRREDRRLVLGAIALVLGLVMIFRFPHGHLAGAWPWCWRGCCSRSPEAGGTLRSRPLPRCCRPRTRERSSGSCASGSRRSTRRAGSHCDGTELRGEHRLPSPRGPT